MEALFLRRRREDDVLPSEMKRGINSDIVEEFDDELCHT